MATPPDASPRPVTAVVDDDAVRGSAPQRHDAGQGSGPGTPPGGGVPDAVPDAGQEPTGFEVHLENFSGPFDVLLSLIAKHRLDITEVALAQVTDEFIAYIRAAEAAAQAAPGAGGLGWDLSTASEFLVVAATLLDLKAARLLPTGEVESEEDLELLEARDLLFARLLQYRAYKDVAATIAARLADEGARFPRIAGLEPEHAALLPELVWTLGPDGLAALAAKALAPPPAPPAVDLTHLHAPAVSVRDQAAIVVARLRRRGTLSFRALVADAAGAGAGTGSHESYATLVTVVRFLALLELFRDGQVAFDQAAPLGELTIRWVGGPGETDLSHLDEFEGTTQEPAPGATDDVRARPTQDEEEVHP